MALGGLVCSLIVGIGGANAQATRTWVSGVGDDVNPCSRTAPCKTFPGAIAKTAIGGEIDVLDPGGFGGVTITKSITIAAEGIGEGGVLVSGTNAITVNCTSALNPACVVILRGLQIDGGPIGSNSLAGVSYVEGAVLEIQNCTVRNFTGGSPNGFGINFQPSANNNQLIVTDSTITTNGPAGGTTGGGIFIVPTGAANVTAVLNHVNVVNNVTGVRADASTGTGTINLSVIDSTVGGNSAGGVVSSTNGGTGIASVHVEHSLVVNNGTGLNANGATATLRVSDSTVSGNSTAAAILHGATMTSAGNNVIQDNTSPGSAIPVLAPN
jgi:hypothetical protein